MRTHALHFRVEDPYPSVRMPGKTKYYRPAALKALAYQAAVAVRAREAMQRRGVERYETELVCLYVTLYHPAPSERGKRRYDIDNVLKATADGCNGVVYKDDWQVIDTRVTLRQSSSARHYAEVTVSIVRVQPSA